MVLPLSLSLSLTHTHTHTHMHMHILLYFGNMNIPSQAAVLQLLHYSHTTGIAISVGHRLGTVAVVKFGKVLGAKKFPTSIVDRMVELDATDEDQSELLKPVTVPFIHDCSVKPVGQLSKYRREPFRSVSLFRSVLTVDLISPQFLFDTPLIAFHTIKE